MDTVVLTNAPAHQLRDVAQTYKTMEGAFVIGDPQTYGKGTFQLFPRIRQLWQG